MSIKHKVGRLDVSTAEASAPVFVIINPAISDAAERAPSVLNRMAARGPQYRVGLVPSATSRKWDFTAEPGSWCTQSVDVSGQHNMQEVLDLVAGQPLPVPIWATQVGEYLCVACDHGVGDSHVVFEICAAVSRGDVDSGFVEPLAPPTTTNPLISALFYLATTTPRLFIEGFLALWKPAWPFFRKIVARLVHRPRQAPSEPAGDEYQDERYVAVWCKSSPEFIQEVRRYRDSKHPDVSAAAILMLSIYRALQEAGVVLDDTLEVVVDLRRFLPPNKSTLANFFSVVRVDIGGRRSMEEFSSALRQTAGSHHTLFVVAAHLVVNRVRSFLARRTGKSGQSSRRSIRSPKTVLTISESKASALAKISWTRSHDIDLAVAGQPADQSHMTIYAYTLPDGSVQLTAAFYPSQTDKSLVLRGLSSALNFEELERRLEPVAEPIQKKIGA